MSQLATGLFMDHLTYEKALLKLAREQAGLSDDDARSMLSALKQKIADGEQAQLGPILLDAGLIDLSSLHDLYAKRAKAAAECEACKQFYFLTSQPKNTIERDGHRYLRCAKCKEIAVRLPEVNDDDLALIAAMPMPASSRPSTFSVLNERPRTRSASTAQLASFKERRAERVVTRERKRKAREHARFMLDYQITEEQRTSGDIPFKDDAYPELSEIARPILKSFETVLRSVKNHPREDFDPSTIVEDWRERLDERVTQEALTLGHDRERIKAFMEMALEKLRAGMMLANTEGLSAQAVATAASVKSPQEEVEPLVDEASDSLTHDFTPMLAELRKQLMGSEKPLKISAISELFEPIYDAMVAVSPSGLVGNDQLNDFLDAKSEVARAHHERIEQGEAPEALDETQASEAEETAAAQVTATVAPQAEPEVQDASIASEASTPVIPEALISPADRPPLSNEEAIAMLQAGEEIKSRRIPRLVISHQEFAKKIVVESCEIGEILADAAIFKRKTSFKGSSFATKPVFANCTFGGEADFKSVRFNAGADFKRTTFERKVSFNYAQFPQHATFTGITFKKDVILSNIYFDRGFDMSGSTAEANFGFSANTVGFRSNFSRCNFKSTTTLSNTIFQDVVDFTKCEFESELKLFSTTFNRIAKFNDVHFRGPALFVQMVVEEDANFTGATFHRELRLDSARSRGAVRLDAATLKDACTLSMNNCQIAELQIAFDTVRDHLDSYRKGNLALASSEFAYLKRNYEQQTEYDSEDKAYYMQRSLGRKASKPKGLYKRVLTALEMLVLDWACGYGTKPINILWAVLLLWAGFAGFFYGVNQAVIAQGVDPLIVSERGADFGPLDAALFSFKWFINADIGDFNAVAGSWVELAVMAEVALGYAILFLLVATFTRKVAR